MLLVLASVGWSPLAAQLGPFGSVALLWPAVVLAIVGGVLAAVQSRFPTRAQRWVRALASSAVWLGLLGVMAASAHTLPDLWWMHPFQDSLREWLLRSWQPTLVLVPLLLAGAGQVGSAVLGGYPRLTRGGLVVVAGVWGGWVSGQSVLLRPWRANLDLHTPLVHAVDPSMPPSMLTTALGAAFAMAVVRGMWPDAVPSTPKMAWHRESSRTEVVLDLPAAGPAWAARLRSRGAAVVALALAAMGAFHLTWLDATTLLVCAAVLLGADTAAQALGRLGRSTRLRLMPAGVRVETRRWGRSQRRWVDRVDFAPEVIDSRDGPIVRLSSSASVLADVDPAALASVLDTYRREMVAEAPADAARARAALGGVPGTTATPAPPIRLPALRWGALFALELPVAGLVYWMTQVLAGSVSWVTAGEAVLALVALVAAGWRLQRSLGGPSSAREQAKAPAPVSRDASAVEDPSRQARPAPKVVQPTKV